MYSFFFFLFSSFFFLYLCKYALKQFVLNKMLLIKLLNFDQINAALMSIRYFFIYLYKCVIKGVIRCDFKFSFLIRCDFKFSFLVISRLCIDNIPEITKTKVSKPKRYSLSKLRLCHALLKRLIQTRPHVYVTVWKDFQNTAQMFTQ